MELALSLGNTSVETKSVGFCMGLSSSSTTRSTADIKSSRLLGGEDNIDDDDDERRSNDVASSSSSDPSPPPLQLDLLPFSPVSQLPRSNTQPIPHPLRFPWLPDNLSSEPGSSDGPGTKLAEEQSSPNSGTSSFMEISLYTRNNNNNNTNGGGKGVLIRRDNNNNNSNNNKNGEEIMMIEGREEGGGGGERGATTSRGSDDDENGSTRKKLRLSKDQSAFLEESFKEHHTLNPKQKLALAKQLNLRPRQVEVWFQNRRARTKLKQTEVDCEYLKRCCETLTEENRRLQKELHELRALKTSQPFFMQLPPTTLTMCPSCERVAPTSSSSAPTTTPTANGGDVTLSLGKSKAVALPFGNNTSQQVNKAGS